MSHKPFLAGLAGLGLVFVISIIARLTLLDGSFFDPAVAPAFGPVAVGDVLAIVAFIAGYCIGRTQQRGVQASPRK